MTAADRVRPSYVRGRRRAEDLIRLFSQPPVDLNLVATTLGAEIRTYELKPDISGILYRDGERRVIVVNQDHSIERQRFTIAHELGHLVLHRGQPVHVDEGFRVNLRDRRSATAEDVEEIEANAFAADLLMPAKWLRADVEQHFIDLTDDNAMHALASRYGVSTQAMAYRLAALSFT
ncbi:ImmA/IrrE family metallo-endopeptidase [Caulobacter sp. RL271]|uniref:ImmA/IrrE family metallo-endopeptidase n=1 Tax=Caulobacter segnis TaxID=88688 RepID=A0ABY4ZTH0_9CAUL|nr:ImmA/IrrE family metallo-endopeptidase [Caulobacter segnis]USQ95893.1 ImmA/IrrE family metallo-endopeptidase [Caulobacter segnis]